MEMWSLKITREECPRITSRVLEVESEGKCSSRKESRRNVKSFMRRRKKQLFSARKKRERRKKKRQRRSLFQPLQWVFGSNYGEADRKESKKAFPGKQMKVHTLLEIASKRVKNVPSDFFEITSSSEMELSQFSAHHNSKSSSISPDKSEERRRRKRNYKHKLHNPPSWLGSLTTPSCPAVLVSPLHALISGDCGVTSVPAHSYAVFSSYRVKVSRVRLLCDSTGCSLAMITLHSSLPDTVGVLCHPVEYVDRILGIHTGQAARDFILQGVSEGDKDSHPVH